MLTTHQLDEAQHRCDRIAIVDQGRVVRVGSFDELVAATIGLTQRLSIRFQKAVDVPTFAVGIGSRRARREAVRCPTWCVELPRLMQQLNSQVDSIEQIMLQGPTLQHVFLYLTGKELRE